MNPEIVGVLKSLGGKTIISIRYQIKKDIKKLSLYMELFSFVALMLFLAVDINNVVQGRVSLTFIIPLILLTGSLLLVKFGFRFDIEDTKNAMRDFINKKSNE